MLSLFKTRKRQARRDLRIKERTKRQRTRQQERTKRRAISAPVKQARIAAGSSIGDVARMGFVEGPKTFLDGGGLGGVMGFGGNRSDSTVTTGVTAEADEGLSTEVMIAIAGLAIFGVYYATRKKK